jgi:hypothetical protein
MEILHKTLSQMPTTFSSNEFSQKAARNGLSQKDIKQGVIALFLHQHAKQAGTRRSWQKDKEKTPEKLKQDKLLEAIKIIKEDGSYKILKKVTEWVEV